MRKIFTAWKLTMIEKKKESLFELVWFLIVSTAGLGAFLAVSGFVTSLLATIFSPALSMTLFDVVLLPGLALMGVSLGAFVATFVVMVMHFMVTEIREWADETVENANAPRYDQLQLF
jgi:uncharacterized membrane protein